MKTKTILLAFLLLTICQHAIAQDYKKDIESEFSAYLTSIISMDFEKSMDYIAPEFFDLVPRSQMIELMDQTFNNPSIEFEFKNPRILKIGDSQKIESKYYSMVTYSNQMNMKIKNEVPETEDEKKMRITMTELSFDETFGAENVAYNENTGFFEIQLQKDMYAISKNGATEWKFLVVEKQQMALLKKLLPKELTDKLEE